MKASLIVAMTLLPFTATSNNDVGELVVIEPTDCGPLARDNFGVAFSAIENGDRKVYFAKGNAGTVCPILLEERKITGFELELCRDYQPENPNECNAIKEFRFD